MQTSPRGLVALVRHEGIVPAPYLDTARVWTFGIGHAETSGLPPNPRLMPRGMPADWRGVLPEVFRLFRLRLAPYERGVRQAVKVTITQTEFDALVSLCFNIGPEAFARSSVVRHLNAANRQAAAEAFRAWNKHRDGAGKLVVSEGLTRRRAEERALFLTGTYATGPVPIYSADASGRLGGVIARMDEAQVLAALEWAGNGDAPAPILATAPTLASPPPAPRVPSLPAKPTPTSWRDRLAAILARFTRRS